jgi:hypothetical protein
MHKKSGWMAKPNADFLACCTPKAFGAVLLLALQDKRACSRAANYLPIWKPATRQIWKGVARPKAPEYPEKPGLI